MGVYKNLEVEQTFVPSFDQASHSSFRRTKMKYAFALAVSALSLDSVVASPMNLESRQSGAGPYAPGNYKTDSSLQGHTIYYPTKSTGSEKLPVLVWGNGACSTDGRSNQALLNNIAR